jgi:hypothetical protein
VPEGIVSDGTPGYADANPSVGITLLLHSTLFSLRKLSPSSRHNPPQHDTSVLRRILRPASAIDMARAQGAAAMPPMAAAPSDTDTSRWETDTASEMDTTPSEAGSIPAYQPVAPTPIPATPVPTGTPQHKPGDHSPKSSGTPSGDRHHLGPPLPRPGRLLR